MSSETPTGVRGVQLRGGGRLERDWLADYPKPLIQAIAGLARRFNLEIHVVGGTVRDWLLGVPARDLDLTVSGDAFVFARALALQLSAAFVPLDETEGVARVVFADLTIDCAGLRQAATTIIEDLWKRDFTINALALRFDRKQAGIADLAVLDPTGGLADLAAGVIRIPSAEVFRADPLRMLRAFRFSAVLGFRVAPQTGELIRQELPFFAGVSAERITHELDLIMCSRRSHAAFSALAESGLLWRILPELYVGVGQSQPSSHHLDVFAHNLAALAAMEGIIIAPGRFFGSHATTLVSYLADGRRPVWLKWAALLHDLGKPASRQVRSDGRITFYNHDRIGMGLFIELARRLRWSRVDRRQVARFIALHMWPFHLINAKRKTGITARACLRIVKAADQELPGLFLLAMADSLAGQGPGKPAGMEEALAELYDEVDLVCSRSIRPVLAQPRLLSGEDLITIFGLTPGPLFRDIFDALEKAQVEGMVRTRVEAESFVRSYVRNV